MAINTNKMNIDEFISVQGIDEYSAFVMKKKHHSVEKSYSEWYKLLLNDFDMGEEQTFVDNDKKSTTKESNK